MSELLAKRMRCFYLGAFGRFLWNLPVNCGLPGNLGNQKMDEIELRAHAAWEDGDLECAFDLFSECAAHGADGCLLNLGYFYDEGVGTSVDKQKAMYWYKKAYRLGSSAAASNVAILYREQGKLQLSAQWFQRSAQLNDGDAEVELAKIYLKGSGVRKSASTAKTYLLNAIASTNITPSGREEAEMLMNEVTDARKSDAKAPS